MIYKIGIVEDSEEDIDNVDRILVDYLGEVFELERYQIEQIKSNEDFQKQIEIIIEDAATEKIHGLILDYKIMSSQYIGKGNDVFEQLKEKIPEFPVIILTEKVEESRDSGNLDYDKIYRKEVFFAPKSKESEDQSINFYKNIERYRRQKNQIKEELLSLQNEEITNGITEDNILKIIELEEKLSKYVIDERSNLDKVINTDNLSEALKIINELGVE